MYIEGNQTVRGTDATVIMEVDGTRYNLFQCKNFESNANITLDDVPRIGTRTIGHKLSTITYEGSMTAYYGEPYVRALFLKYVNSGKWPNISITTVNYDQDTGIRQFIAIHKGVHFSSVPIARIDAEATSLEEDIDFTSDEVVVQRDFDILPGGQLAPGELGYEELEE